MGSSSLSSTVTVHLQAPATLRHYIQTFLSLENLTCIRIRSVKSSGDASATDRVCLNHKEAVFLNHSTSVIPNKQDEMN